MAQPTILIIDDYPRTLDLLESLLQESGLRILKATNGAMALKILSDETPDLILLDILIPDIDGYELCKLIKNSPATSDIPIIFLTALSQREDILRGLKTGAVDYITKPFDLEEVSARINIHLELKQARETIIRLNKDLFNYNMEYEEEIIQASQFIKSILPQPIDKPVNISWEYYPSRGLGGDTFNYYMIDDSHLIMYLLDVSGHGLVAALLSISITNILRSHALPGVDFLNPAEVLKDLNQKFQIENQGGKYFTIWYGIYDTKNAVLTYASGGHPPPIMLRLENSRRAFLPMGTCGLPIGLFEDCGARNYSLEIRKDDILYVLSDGVFEINSPEEIYFGYENLRNLLLQLHTFDEEILAELLKRLREFHCSDTFDDDFTLMQLIFD